jgi:raffinose/stachyose/melibiose transport system substrate-binding protein
MMLVKRFRVIGILLALALVASACVAAPAAETGQDMTADETMDSDESGALTGKLTVNPGSYYPSESMEWSETNPNPHNMILTIIEEYQALNPGAEIELVQPPPGDVSSREYIVTNMTAGTIPHVVYTLTRDQVEEIGKDWWVNLDSYLDKPNHYVEAGEPGSERWLDLFYEVPFQANRILGSHYTLNYSIVTSMMFYNKDIFAEVGVEIPTTVAELLAVFQALEDAGHTPYGGIGSWFMYETLGQLGGSIMAELTPQVNPDGGPANFEEVACAIDRGIFRGDTPEYREWMRVMKEVAAYRTPEWTDKNANAITKWLQGDIVVVEDGSWRVKQNKLNPNIEFEWGMFYAPRCTQESSPVCTGAPAPPIGGAPGGFAITKTAVEDGVVDLAADFLKYLSAPQNAERLINDLGNVLPIQKGATPADPDLIAILENLQDHEGEAAMWTYYDKTNLESRLEIWDIKNAYILDLVSLDDAVAQIDENMTLYASDFISDNEVDCAALGFE